MMFSFSQVICFILAVNFPYLGIIFKLSSILSFLKCYHQVSGCDLGVALFCFSIHFKQHSGALLLEVSCLSLTMSYFILLVF